MPENLHDTMLKTNIIIKDPNASDQMKRIAHFDRIITHHLIEAHDTDVLPDDSGERYRPPITDCRFRTYYHISAMWSERMPTLAEYEVGKNIFYKRDGRWQSVDWYDYRPPDQKALMKEYSDYSFQ